MNSAELILKTAYSSAIALAAILKTRSARRLGLAQNHIDREGLRLNFGHLVTCYTNERCLRCFDVFASRDSPFFCFELYYIWEIAFSPTKNKYNEYNCILANIVHEDLKHVSDISWGYVTHIQPRTLLVVLVDVKVYIHQNHSTCPDPTYEPLPITIVKSPKRQGFLFFQAHSYASSKY